MIIIKLQQPTIMLGTWDLLPEPIKFELTGFNSCRNKRSQKLGGGASCHTRFPVSRYLCNRGSPWFQDTVAQGPNIANSHSAII